MEMMDIEAYQMESIFIVNDGYHCIVVEKNNKSSCRRNYGDGWWTGREKIFVTSNRAYKSWLLKFCPQNDNGIDKCGLTFKKNGVCQTYAAREMLIGEKEISLSNVKGNDACLFWFGKYGMGREQLKKRLIESYKEAYGSEAETDILDTVLKRVDNYIIDECIAWYRVAKDRVGIPVDQILYKNYDAGIAHATRRLKKWIETREEIFAKWENNRQETNLGEELKSAMLIQIKEYLDFLTPNYITPYERDTYFSNTKTFIYKLDNVLAHIDMQPSNPLDRFQPNNGIYLA